MKRIQSDYDLLVSEGYEVVMVSLYGSDNYKLSYEGSDIDTKAIVLPRFNDFVLNKKAFSHTKILDTPMDEHIDIKDIRVMFECYRKQNINFIETLFSKYMYVNPKYAKLFQPMLDYKERIARLNNYASVNCIAGMVYEKYKALEHPYPSIIDKIAEYGYDPKQLHHILRCSEFLDRYILGLSYEDILIPSNIEYLINVKRGIHDLTEARELANIHKSRVETVKNEYMKNNPVKIDEEMIELMNNVLISILKLNFKTELFNQNIWR